MVGGQFVGITVVDLVVIVLVRLVVVEFDHSVDLVG